MTDENRQSHSQVRELARDVAAYFADILRAHHSRRSSSRLYRDPHFLVWLAHEARAVVTAGIERDPWSEKEVDTLAQKIRAAVTSERAGVRLIRGRPVSTSVPTIDHTPGEPFLSPIAGPIPWIQQATAAGIGRELWDEDCDTWISLPEDLPLGRYVALNVRGESMHPLLHDGDVVLVRMGHHAARGDVVLARTEDGYVVKRLARISTDGVHLESLNPDYRPVTVRDIRNPIVGMVVLRWCEHESDGDAAG